MSNQSPPVTASVPPSDENTLGMITHLLALAGYAVPLGNIIGPLIIWLLKREQSEYVDYHGKEALNFQISITVYFIVALILCFVFIGFLLMPLIAIFNLIFIIVAAIKAKEGMRYRYPLCLRII